MSFDRLARHYRWMEFVLAGEKLQRCRTAFLDRVSEARNILILGEGNGRFLVECRRKLPKARITCVDASARMLALAANRLEKVGLNSDSLEFVHADALRWRPRRVFDLVVTHFFLDCFLSEQLGQVIAGLAAAVQRRGAWLLSDFQVPEKGFARCRALVIHRLMYAFFRVITRLPADRLTAPDHLLEAHGFRLRERCVTDWGLLHSDWWSAPD